MPILEHVSTGLHNQVAKDLGLKILREELPPGTVLPNEAILSAQFGVSRTVLREAVKVLASKGLMEVRRKTGTRVRSQKHWHSLDPEVLAWQFSIPQTSAALDDLLELRRLIEPAAARLASRRATAAELTAIKRALGAMEETHNDSEEATEVDLLFHLAVLEASHNQYLRSLGAIVKAALRASFQLTNADAAAYERSLQRHRAVVVAIEKKDPASAEKAMYHVLDQTETDIRASLSKKSMKKGKKNSRKKL